MVPTRKLPSRLHHTAYTTKDMEKTRAFYEEVIGLPLVATWSEADELFGKVRTYCHCFFGLGGCPRISPSGSLNPRLALSSTGQIARCPGHPLITATPWRLRSATTLCEGPSQAHRRVSTQLRLPLRTRP